MASRVDEWVEARCSLGEEGGKLGGEGCDELAVAELSHQADDRVGAPSHQPYEDHGEAEPRNPNLVNRVPCQLKLRAN